MNTQPETPTTYELASFGTRFAAFIIDIIVMALIRVMLSFLLSMLQIFDPMQIEGFLPDPMFLVLDIAVMVPYHWYFWTRQHGQTPGKRIMNIRIIKTNGAPISDMDALVRISGYYIGQLTLFLGYLWAAFDANNQAWHDKMANTYVVLAPQDKKTITL